MSSAAEQPAAATGERAALPHLLGAPAYTPCDWDLAADAEGRARWLDLFERQFDHIAACAAQSGYDPGAALAAQDRLNTLLNDLRNDHRALGDRLDILVLDRARDGLLREHGIDDAFRAVKAQENERALQALPARLAAIDALPPERRLEELIRGVFAGNLFDMGAARTAAMFMNGAGPAFGDCLDRAPERAWCIDHLDAAGGRFNGDGFEHAVLFVDNAGADVVLGMLPLARELARRGARVTLAANERPSLNDITAPELEGVLGASPEMRSLAQAGALCVASTGSADPLIDLADLDAAFCESVAGADLVVLEGMGRGLESNWAARLGCETWRVAIVKTETVAERRGTKLFGGVFRRDAPAAEDAAG